MLGRRYDRWPAGPAGPAGPRSAGPQDRGRRPFLWEVSRVDHHRAGQGYQGAIFPEAVRLRCIVRFKRSRPYRWRRRALTGFWLLCSSIFMLSACRNGSTAPGEPVDAGSGVASSTGAAGDSGPGATSQGPLEAVAVEPLPSATPLPTPTPSDPPVALVNGRPIPLSAFRLELARYEQGLADPQAAALDYPRLALEALIVRVLIAQAADELGLVVTPAMVEAELATLRQQAETAGGPAAFSDWLAANRLSETAFRDLLAAEMLTSRVAERVTAEVPAAVEQIQARVIQVDDPALADSLLAQLRAGADFGQLATQFSLDQSTAPFGGDLGYFARGTLLVPEIEAAAFALELNGISEVITVTRPETGRTLYYLVQTTARDPQRPMDPEFRHRVLLAHFDQWLADRRAAAAVEIMIDLAAP